MPQNAPPPPPPRRPPPAARPSTQLSTSTTASASSASSSSGMLRARALASKVNKLAHQTSDYAAPKLTHAASKVKDAYGAYSASHATGSSAGMGERGMSTNAWGEREVLTTPKKALRSRQLQGVDAELPTLAGTSGKTGTGSVESTPPTSPVNEKGASSSRWGGWGSYFMAGSYSEEGQAGTAGNAGGQGKIKIGADDIEEDKVVCFPGWATLSPSHASLSGLPSSEPALILEIHTHGYAYRQRPLASASRSQRIFYALAKSFAALPKLPNAIVDKAEEAAEAALKASRGGDVDNLSLSGSMKEEVVKEGEVLEQLLDIGGRDGTGSEQKELAEATVAAVEGREPRTRTSTAESALSDEPEEMSIEERLMSPTTAYPSEATPTASPAHSSYFPPHPHPPPHHAATAPPSISTAPPSASSSPISSSPEDVKILSNPSRLSRRPHVRIEIPSKRAAAGAGGFSALRSPSLPSSPSSPLPTPRGVGSGGFGSSRSRPCSVTSSRASSRANSPTRSARLPPSSCSPDPATIPPETWPHPFSSHALTPSLLRTFHTNLHTRLLPFLALKLPARKIRLTIQPILPQKGQLFDGVLARKVVSTTSPGGGWKTRFSIEGKDLKRWLEATGKGELKIRVVSELIEPEASLSAVDSLGWEGGAGIGGSVGLGGAAVGEKRGLDGWEYKAHAVARDECTLGVCVQGEGGEGTVRVVSDVDDTIKWTEVVKGTKTIFRNCFVRELHEIRVPGMSTLYRTLHSLPSNSVHFHYVSNSPWELFPVIRSFLRVANFPSGSVTLKEYGGAASTLAKLWEEPGARKRANVEGLLKEFPGSRFILVGDSGEQDLQLYASLAAQYPDQVIAIYIRDVTTPFHPHAHAGSLASTSSTKPMAPPTDVEWHHSDSQNDLASLVKEEVEEEELASRVDDVSLSSSSAPSAAAVSPPPPSQPQQQQQQQQQPYKPYEPKKKLRKPPPPPPLSTLPSRPSLGGRSLSQSILAAVHVHGGSKDRGVDSSGRRSQASTPTSSRPPSPTWPSSASSPPASSTHSRSSSLSRPSRSTTDPTSLYDSTSDPLSPNNPLRPSLPPAPAPATPAGNLAVIEGFYRKVAEAERVVPKGCLVRIFRGGEEIKEECLGLVRKAMGRG
ncbi:hypothetical protein JCM11641_005605 [Rhodosporidiobolus odoratus]